MNHCKRPGKMRGISIIFEMKMTSIALTLFAALAFGFAREISAQTSAATEADAKKAIIGTWSGQMVDSEGAAHGEIKLEITADGITATNPRGGHVMGAGTYRISARAGKTMQIDARGTDGQFKGRKYEGIFSIDGKTLKWCSANDNPKSKRPAELRTNQMQGQFLMVLEKQ